MFTKVLIANRGAIACRIIRTLRQMDVASVAVFSEADRQSLHVRQADEAVCIGPGPAAEGYLNSSRILRVAKYCGAQAIHPGYGFLSENAEFAEACAAQNIVFIGPDPEQMRLFGLKHQARALALKHGVPLLPGSQLLDNLDDALEQAKDIAYPVMLKSTAGGGGIGMHLCRDADELENAYHGVERLAQNHFSQGGIFLEKFVETARHIEVQIFGDGEGQVVHLGARDCSVQRRNQKVIEETPPPGLDEAICEKLCASAVALGQAIQYRSAGTVEFLFDSQTQAFYFLEVNTRLQVEHGVTEEVSGVDLVQWMLNIAAGDNQCLLDWQEQQTSLLQYKPGRPRKHAIQVRLYAEDPGKNFQPCAGLLTEVVFPESLPGNPYSNPAGRDFNNLRIDTWVETGTEISAYYDPLLAKIIASGNNRSEALRTLAAALSATRIAGIESNLGYLSQILGDETFVAARHTTDYLNHFDYRPSTIDVVQPGTQSLIVDYPGRLGYWDVGIPPSGPMDDYAHRFANQLLGNRSDAPTLEITVSGPTLRFNTDCIVALTGVTMPATLDNSAVGFYRPVKVGAGSTLKIGAATGGGLRAYLAIAGGFDVPVYMGSKTTFTLGQFGGHGGRALRAGDVLHVAGAEVNANANQPSHNTAPKHLIPEYSEHSTIRVMYGPHGAPDFFTATDIETFFSTSYEVHYNSSRTGVRLIGPKPDWARTDGGEAGLHPSNIHDTAYAVGAIDFTGDMPIILGPDGPSLGGFVCPATIIKADLWKVGQLKPGNTVRFVCVDVDQAHTAQQQQDKALAGLTVEEQSQASGPVTEAKFSRDLSAGVNLPLLNSVLRSPVLLSPVLLNIEARGDKPAVCYRQAGDNYLLVEYGPLVLDLALRFRVHELMGKLRSRAIPGIIDLTPGIRSLQIHYDSNVLRQSALLDTLQAADSDIENINDMVLPSRIVHLPLSWDDLSTQLAIQRYRQSVRADAPWCPSNIEFIRRINGLSSVDEVKKIVFDASYLVLGLGDVYLGAPVATPIDPRHCLVTTKYNPARTWTPENAVGIGGAYLCVYGMEGPGGYQFVGRTIQMWNRYRQTNSFIDGKQWLLRFFDQIRFYEVSHDELQHLREDFPLGRFCPLIEQSNLNLGQYQGFLADNEAAISAFKHRQQTAFEAERLHWEATGQAYFEVHNPGGFGDKDNDALSREPATMDLSARQLPDGYAAIVASVTGTIWQLEAQVGEPVNTDDPVIIIEAMKMEVPVTAPQAGVLTELLCEPGGAVQAGQLLAIVKAVATVIEDEEHEVRNHE